MITAITLHSQEKLSYTINGKTLEFKVSPDKFYVEFLPNKKATIERRTKNSLQILSKNSALITVKNPRGNLSARRSQLQSSNSSLFQKTEPMLIYKGGRHICKGELIIKLSNKQDLKELLKGYNYTAKENEFVANQFLVKLKNKNDKNDIIEITKGRFDININTLYKKNLIFLKNSCFLKF